MTDTPAEVPRELQSLVEQLHGPHIVIDAEYRIVVANGAYDEFYQRLFQNPALDTYWSLALTVVKGD